MSGFNLIIDPKCNFSREKGKESSRIPMTHGKKIYDAHNKRFFTNFNTVLAVTLFKLALKALVKFIGTWKKVYSLWQHFIIHPNMV